MKSLIFILLISISINSYPDVYGRVCIEKATGRLLEFQQGDALLGTLKQNRTRAGDNPNDIEEKKVTKAEWLAIEDTWITQPAKEKKQQKENQNKIKEDNLRTKLGLTKQDFKDLKEVIN
ncbi:MAG TPA: hypothetical protein ENI23_06465 [bacterium]|nr:hypothetical protein [bacterium]